MCRLQGAKLKDAYPLPRPDELPKPTKWALLFPPL